MCLCIYVRVYVCVYVCVGGGAKEGGMVAKAEVREKEKGQREREREREKLHERGLRVDGVLGRKNRREIRDKETNIDNEKTSMAKKEAGRRSGRRR